MVCPSLHVSTGRPPCHSQALPKQPVIAVLLGVSPPLPALPSTQERQGIPHRETAWGLKGPRPERAPGTGGPPQVGETRWLVGRHPPLSCRLGRSRRVLQVLLAHVPPQGCSQPRGPWQHHTHSPTPLTAGLAPSAVTPSPLAACPGLELF